jgi:hypothetical protein
MVCKGDPLSTLVNMGSHSALGVFHVTHLVVPGHEAPFSLPQSVAFAAGTIVHADVLQLLPVGGLEDDKGTRGGALLAFFCPARKLPLSSLKWHRADSPMTACITNELLGSLLKLISDQ